MRVMLLFMPMIAVRCRSGYLYPKALVMHDTILATFAWMPSVVAALTAEAAARSTLLFSWLATPSECLQVAT